LYILGRREVFESCYELAEVFERLLPPGGTDKLALVPGEMFPTSRGVADEVESTEMEGVEHLGQYVYEMTQAKVEALKAGNGEISAPEVEGALEKEFREDEEMDEIEEVDDEEDMEEGAEETVALREKIENGE
jgi:intron-binding protein aquarius